MLPKLNYSDQPIHRDITEFRFVEIPAGDSVRLSDVPDLQKYFGDSLPSILADDPRPVVILFTHLLDKGDLQGGEKSWVFGHYGVWLTESQFLKDMAPVLKGAPGYGGHLYGGDWQLPKHTVVWVGLDEVTGTPAAASYIRPEQREMREAMRTTAKLKTWRRDFPVSLDMRLQVNPQNNQLMKILKPERSSLDYVRSAGTEKAGASRSIMLHEKNKDNEDSAMLSFESIAAMLANPEVAAMIEQKAQAVLNDPAKIKSILLAAKLDDLKENDAVKILLARPENREAVVKSLTVEEIGVALTEKPELREKAVEVVTQLQEKGKEFTEKARGILQECKLSDDQVNTALAMYDFSHGDEAKVKALAIQLAKNLNPGAGDGIQTKVSKVAPGGDATGAVSYKELMGELDVIGR